MTVTCKCHGKKIDKNNAYCVQVNGRNTYYCSEADYVRTCAERKAKQNIHTLIVDIYGYDPYKTGAFYKPINEVLEQFGIEPVLQYLQSNRAYLSNVMRRNFNSEYGKARYFVTVVGNNMRNFSLENIIKLQTGYEKLDTKYTPRAKRRSIDDIENAFVGGGDDDI